MTSSHWLVVNADDLGVCKGATLGIVEAHQKGIVTSASLAPTTPFYQHAVETCVRMCPDLGIGLHFTLTSGTPVSPGHQVSSLIDASGMFRWRFMSLLAAVVAPGRAQLLDHIEAELDAQIMCLKRDGIHPDHINGERHVHLIPGIFERVVAAAQRHDIGFVRLGYDFGCQLFKIRDTAGLLLGGGMAKSLLLSRLSARNRLLMGGGLSSPDYVASYLYTGRTHHIITRIRDSVKTGSVVEVMVHPGLPEENGELMLGNCTLERYLTSPSRRSELQACKMRPADLRPWQLTNYRSLKATSHSE